MDQKKRDEFSERIFGEVNAAMSVLTLYIGERLGLFRAIKAMGSVTPKSLAHQMHGNERYLREWLKCMAVNGYLEHDPGPDAYRLPPEHASVFLDRDTKTYAIPHVRLIPSFASVLPELVQGFQDGRGVPFDAYGPDLTEAIAAGNRAFLVNDLMSKWIPAMPDIQSRLAAGGRIADVGSGKGWLSILVAQGFPEVRIDAIDPDAASVQEARANAAHAGVGERIVFHRSSLEDAQLTGPYDLITAVECVHDMTHPVRALRRMHQLVAPEGAVLIVDEAGGETVEENATFVGRLLYNFSVLHCLPQAMGEADTAATGAVMAASTLRSYAREAGFRQVDILPVQNPLWRFYRLNP